MRTDETDQEIVCFFWFWYRQPDWLTRGDGWRPEYIPREVMLAFDEKNFVTGPGWRRTIEQVIGWPRDKRRQFASRIEREMLKYLIATPTLVGGNEHNAGAEEDDNRKISFED